MRILGSLASTGVVFFGFPFQIPLQFYPLYLENLIIQVDVKKSFLSNDLIDV